MGVGLLCSGRTPCCRRYLFKENRDASARRPRRSERDREGDSSPNWPLPWLTERLYRRRTGVPVNRLLGVRTERESESGVSGVDGAVAL